MGSSRARRSPQLVACCTSLTDCHGRGRPRHVGGWTCVGCEARTCLGGEARTCVAGAARTCVAGAARTSVADEALSTARGGFSRRGVDFSRRRGADLFRRRGPLPPVLRTGDVQFSSEMISQSLSGTAQRHGFLALILFYSTDCLISVSQNDVKFRHSIDKEMRSLIRIRVMQKSEIQ